VKWADYQLQCMAVIKMRLHEASIETSQMGRLPAPSNLPRVKVYRPTVHTSNVRQGDGFTWQVTWNRQPAHLTCLSTCLIQMQLWSYYFKIQVTVTFQVALCLLEFSQDLDVVSDVIFVCGLCNCATVTQASLVNAPQIHKQRTS
jgi:hypothetical protein